MKWLSFALLLVAAPAWGQATGGTAAHIDGLRVVGGSNIYAKNRTAGENYANLYVNIW